MAAQSSEFRSSKKIVFRKNFGSGRKMTNCFKLITINLCCLILENGGKLEKPSNARDRAIVHQIWTSRLGRLKRMNPECLSQVIARGTLFTNQAIANASHARRESSVLKSTDPFNANSSRPTKSGTRSFSVSRQVNPALAVNRYLIAQLIVLLEMSIRRPAASDHCI